MASRSRSKRVRAGSVNLPDAQVENWLVEHVTASDVAAEDVTTRLFSYDKSYNMGPDWVQLHKQRCSLGDLVVLTRGRLLKQMVFERQLKTFFDRVCPGKFSWDDISAVGRIVIIK